MREFMLAGLGLLSETYTLALTKRVGIKGWVVRERK